MTLTFDMVKTLNSILKLPLSNYLYLHHITFEFQQMWTNNNQEKLEMN